MKMIRRCATPVSILLALAGTAFAQDPPSRVARLSYLTGAVSFEPASVDEWAPASLNYPVTTGDNLYTDPSNARAVLRVGRDSLRLAPGTNFQMVQLSDQIAQMSINSGALSVRVRNIQSGESWEVDTPNGAVTLLQDGEYRIDTDPNQNASMVTVRSGQVQVTTTSNQSFAVSAGQTAYVDANGQPQIESQNPNDAFDEFAYARDRMEDIPPPAYISGDVNGYEDLAANGSWSDNGDYGHVWFPRVSAGWAPYQSGHWAWVDPWGWTWVDDASWGFAPFHYGRWANVSGRWGWCPGPVGARAVYAPALVAFIGGSSWGVSFSIGGASAVGWFPLGPREPYYPSYQVSPAYIRQVNITNTNITNINVNVTNIRNVTYMNQRVAGGVTAVPQNAFATGRPVNQTMVRVQPAQLAQAHVVGVAAPVVPQRQAVLASVRAGGSIPRPPANIASRPVVARIAPPARAVPFAAKQQMLQAHPGQPVPQAQLAQYRPSAPAPGRAPIQTVVPSQVHAIKPAINTAPRPAVASRPGVVMPPPSVAARPGNTPAPMNAARPNSAPAPAATRPMTPPANTAAPRQNNVPAPNAQRPNTAPVTPPMNTPRPMAAPPAANRPAMQPPAARPQAIPERQAPAAQQPRPQAIPERQAPAAQQPRPQAIPQRQAPAAQQPRPQAIPERQAPAAQQPRPQAIPQRQAPAAQQPRPQAIPERQAPAAQQPRPAARPEAARPEPAARPEATRQPPPPQRQAAPARQEAAPRKAPAKEEPKDKEK